jgi:hypothetical protein
MKSPSGDYPHFNQQVRTCESCLDTGACRRVTFGNPGVPDGIHRGKMPHAGNPDLCTENLAAIGTGLGEQLVDLLQYLLCLHSDIGPGVGCDLTCEVNGIAVDDDLAHALVAVMAGDAHIKFLYFSVVINDGLLAIDGNNFARVLSNVFVAIGGDCHRVPYASSKTAVDADAAVDCKCHARLQHSFIALFQFG